MGKLHRARPGSKPGSPSPGTSPRSAACFGPAVDFTRPGCSGDGRRLSGRRAPVGGIGEPRRVQNTTGVGGSLRRNGRGSSRGARVAGGISAVARSNGGKGAFTINTVRLL